MTQVTELDKLLDQFNSERINEEDTTFLVMADKLVLTAIEEQIKKRDCHSKDKIDYIADLNKKFKFMKNDFEENDPQYRVLINKEYSLYYTILTEYFPKLGIIYNERSDKDSIDIEDLYILVHNIYQFFILDYGKNLVKFFKNYITSNKASIVDRSLKNNELNKRDLDYILGRRKFIDRNLLIISYFLSGIIKEIREEMNYRNHDIITYITHDDPDEILNEFIKTIFKDSMFQKVLLTTEFDELFFEPIDKHEIHSDLISYINSYLLNL